MAKKPTKRPAPKPWHGGPPPALGVTFDQAVADYVVNEMYDGKTWVALCREPGIPSRSTLCRWEEEYPDFAKKVDAARRANAQLYFEEAREEIDDSNMSLTGQVNNQTGLPGKPYYIAATKAGLLLRMAVMRAPSVFSERRVAPEGPPSFKPDLEAQQRLLASVNDRLSKKSSSAKG